MAICSRIGGAGATNVAGSFNAQNYLMDATGSTLSVPVTYAQFALVDGSQCDFQYFSGAEYVALLASIPVPVGKGSSMATCLMRGYAGNTASGPSGAINYYQDASHANITPLVLAEFLLVDPNPKDLSQCQAVALSGADFQAITAMQGSVGGSGGSAVNVSADIFIGAALVLCLAVGWIAGGQR